MHPVVMETSGNFEVDPAFNQPQSPADTSGTREAEGTLLMSVPVAVKSVIAVHERQLINNRGTK